MTRRVTPTTTVELSEVRSWNVQSAVTAKFGGRFLFSSGFTTTGSLFLFLLLTVIVFC